MKTTFTPGPWELQAGRSIVTSSGNFYLSYGKDNAGNPNFRDFCELDRNAQLIAAAPDLFAALDAMIKAGEYQFGESGWPAFFHNGALTNARAAIAKAKG